MDGWNTSVSFWGPAYFQGLSLFVSGRVIPFSLFSGEFDPPNLGLTHEGGGGPYVCSEGSGFYPEILDM